MDVDDHSRRESRDDLQELVHDISTDPHDVG
jgi:hypothetical protein